MSFVEPTKLLALQVCSTIDAPVVALNITNGVSNIFVSTLN